MLAAAALYLTAPPANAATACAAQNATDARTARAIRLELRCLINAERTGRGLNRLRPNGALFRAAGRHAHDMVRRGYFSHYSRSGSDPTSRVAGAGYLHGTRRYAIGENIAWQQERDARSIVSSWLRSPGHRRLLLSPNFRELGIGVAKSSPSGDGRGLTAVVDFGRTKRR